MALDAFLRQQATPALVAAVERAIAAADSSGHPIYLAHLVNALLADPAVRARMTPDVWETASAELVRQLRDIPPSPGSAGEFDFDLDLLAAAATALAKDAAASKVSPLVFLATCLAPAPMLDALSEKTRAGLRAVGLFIEQLLPRPGAAARADFTFAPLGFGTDLTALARAGRWPTCPLIGMRAELRRLVCLLGTGVDSVALVGEPGVGKSALVEGLTWHLAHGTWPLIPREMVGWSVVLVTPAALLAGASARGELEERLLRLLNLCRRNPTVIPFFDEMHTLLDAQDASARTVATGLKPPMARGEFRCIGATTDREYARFIAADDAMNSRFTKLLIPEPDTATAVRILTEVLPAVLPPPAVECGLTVDAAALRAAVRVTAQYQRNDRLPRKALRLLRTVIAEKLYALQTAAPEASLEPTVTEKDIVQVFSDVSGIPADDLSADRVDWAKQLSGRLTKRVRGQGPAVSAVVDWLDLQARGWLDQRRPRGRFLFLGPPGVGKTELALALAEEVIRDRGSLVVKNMAEYQGQTARSRFMGADPGYVGYGETQTVYSRVSMRPYSIVVLDEFEKAVEDLANPLLSILDGWAEDSRGQAVDFSQCIFVLTSNALAGLPLTSDSEIRQRLLRLGGIWQPALLDRLDRVVSFQPLDRVTLSDILETLLTRRKQAASRPLPEALEGQAARDQILAWATESGGEQSARGLERALLRWLAAAVDQPGFDSSSKEGIRQ
jgi:ATP-dependent Clp protease ATP-binding subunit ClpC